MRDATRYVGTVRLVRSAKIRAGDPDHLWWEVLAAPHVRLHLKRLFPRLDKGKFGALLLKATDEVSRDLEWFLTRYPMKVADPGELERRARAYDTRLDSGWNVLEGRYEAPTERGMALPPRAYQVQAAELLRHSRGLLLADELGLGKTVTAITAMTNPGGLPAIVVCPAHLPRQWAREITRFLPHVAVHVAKKSTPYALADKQGRLPDVLVMSMAKLSGWADTVAGHYRTFVFDECQALRRPASDRYHAAAHVAAGADYRLGLSGTPIYNYGAEWWAVLNVLAPDHLGTRDEFVREWCVKSRGDAAKARLSDPKAFGRYLRENLLMLRRTRADVGEELPAQTTFVHEVDTDETALDAVQAPAAELARIILAQGGQAFDKMRAASEFSNKLRQATGIAKARAVAGLARMLVEAGTPIVLWGWHREVYAIWLAELEDLEPAMYTGSESVAGKEREAGRFLNGETDVLIMSLRSGAGLDGLQARCCTGVFGELDWSPGVHQQCEGRLLRSGQTQPVFFYYVVSDSGADPIMVDVLGVKRGQLEGARDPDGDGVLRQQGDPAHIRRLAADYLERSGGSR